MTDQHSSANYPILLTGLHRRALVIGAGPVAQRKIAGLMAGGIAVTVLAPLTPEGHPFADEGVELIRGSWPQDAPDLSKFHLIFATTDNRAINADVAIRARVAGVPVNVADAPEECDFFTVGTIRDGGAIISISTGGRSPTEARRLREELEEWLRSRSAQD